MQEDKKWLVCKMIGGTCIMAAIWCWTSLLFSFPSIKSEEDENNRNRDENRIQPYTQIVKILPPSHDERLTKSAALVEAIPEKRVVKQVLSTVEWEEVKPGEICPVGCEFQMDFATGKNYVRLLPRK